MPDASSVNWTAACMRRVKAIWPWKIAATVLLNLFFWSCYLFLSHHAVFPVREMPLTWLDRSVEFQPYPWVWIYLSEFLLTGLLPWGIVNREELKRYLVGMGCLVGGSMVVFLFFPVFGPRVVGMEMAGELQWLTRVDGPLNSFPSLHAGGLVFHVLLVKRLFGAVPRWLTAGLVCWALLVLFSTLAIRQHYVLDLVAGGLWGWVSDRVGWHRQRGEVSTI